MLVRLLSFFLMLLFAFQAMPVSSAVRTVAAACTGPAPQQAPAQDGEEEEDSANSEAKAKVQKNTSEYLRPVQDDCAFRASAAAAEAIRQYRNYVEAITGAPKRAIPTPPPDAAHTARIPA